MSLDFAEFVLIVLLLQRPYNTLIKGYNVGPFSGQFFHIFEIRLFCFVVTMSDQVHNVEAIHGIC